MHVSLLWSSMEITKQRQVWVVAKEGVTGEPPARGAEEVVPPLPAQPAASAQSLTQFSMGFRNPGVFRLPIPRRDFNFPENA